MAFSSITISNPLTVADGSITTAKLANTAVTTAKIADDAVTNAKVGTEFTTASALTAGATIAVDYTSAQIFTLTPGQNTTLNITNPVKGVSKAFVITGTGSSYTITFNVGGSAGTFNKIIGDYDDTSGKKNFIQIMCVGATEFWYTISQPA